MAEADLATAWRLDAQSALALASGTHGDPFSVLGPRDTPAGRVIRAFMPGALNVDVIGRADRAPIGSLERRMPHGLFEGVVQGRIPYLLRSLRSGPPMRRESPCSATSIHGTAAAIPCACVTVRGSGSCSCPASPRLP